LRKLAKLDDEMYKKDEEKRHEKEEKIEDQMNKILRGKFTEDDLLAMDIEY